MSWCCVLVIVFLLTISHVVKHSSRNGVHYLMLDQRPLLLSELFIEVRRELYPFQFRLFPNSFKRFYVAWSFFDLTFLRNTYLFHLSDFLGKNCHTVRAQYKPSLKKLTLPNSWRRIPLKKFVVAPRPNFRFLWVVCLKGSTLKRPYLYSKLGM